MARSLDQNAYVSKRHARRLNQVLIICQTMKKWGLPERLGREVLPVGEMVLDHVAAEADALQTFKAPVHHDAMQLLST